jgi:Spy/CpxP family protein refolding chaperone
MNGIDSKGRWRLWSGVIAVFVAGVIVGGLSTSVLIRSHVIHVMRSGPPRPMERVAERLTGNLELTADQRAEVDRIMAEFGPRFDEFDRRSRAEVRTIATEMETQIRNVLAPAQQATFDANLERMRDEFKKREHRDRRGGPPKE